MARNKVGMRLGDTIGAVVVGAFLVVCLVGGFGNMFVNDSVAKSFAVVDTEADPNAKVFEPQAKVDEAQYEESGFVKSWAYDEEATMDGWTRFKAKVFGLGGTTLELKEDGTGTINFDGENDVDITWRITGKNAAVLYDNEGNEFPMSLNDGVLTMDFPAKGMAFSEAEEEEGEGDQEATEQETPEAKDESK